MDSVRFARKTKSGFCACVVTFKWTRSRFARKTKSGFCACVVTFKWTRSVSRERRNLVSAHVPSYFIRSLPNDPEAVAVLIKGCSDVNEGASYSSAAPDKQCKLTSTFLSRFLTNLVHKTYFTICFISCLYMFRAHVLIIRRSKLH